MATLETYDELMAIEFELPFLFTLDIISLTGGNPYRIYADHCSYPIFDYSIDESEGLFSVALSTPNITASVYSRLNVDLLGYPWLLDESYFEQWGREQIHPTNFGFNSTPGMNRGLRDIQITRYVNVADASAVSSPGFINSFTRTRQDTFRCYLKDVPSYDGDGSNTSSVRMLNITFIASARVGRTNFSYQGQ